jgi:carboxylesterase type B
MVYFHAGEFRAGSANDQENNLPYFSHSDQEIILVTINSRLGAFGYLASEHLRRRSPDNSTGNYGIQDQRMALQFIRDNIGAFRGDASNVLIFGESSGGTEVGAHLTNPRSFGLFSKIALESAGLTQVKPWVEAVANHDFTLLKLALVGSPHCELSTPAEYTAYESVTIDGKKMKEVQNITVIAAQAMCSAMVNCTGFIATRIGNTTDSIASTVPPIPLSFTFFKDVRELHREKGGPGYTAPMADQRVDTVAYARAAAGVSSSGSYDVEMACLTSASADTIVSVSGHVMPYSDTFFTDSFGPVIDGVEMTQSIVASIKQGAIAPGVSGLLGSNMDEGTLFMGVTPYLEHNASLVQYHEWCRRFFGQELGKKIPALYQHLSLPFPAVPLPPPYNTTNAGRWWTAAMRSAGDIAIRCPARLLAKRIAAQAAAIGASPQAFVYLFSMVPKYSMNYNLTKPPIGKYGAFHGAEVPFVFGDSWELVTDEERGLSKAMGCFWATFAQTGDPNRNSGSGRCSHVAWPKYMVANGGDNSSADASIRLESPISTQVGLNAAACDLFEQYM